MFRPITIFKQLKLVNYSWL